MKKLLYLLFIALVGLGCKKDKDEETTPSNNNTTPNPVTTPTQVKVSVDLYGEVQDFIFAENNYSLQFMTSAMSVGDSTWIAPSTTISNLGIPGNTFDGYLSLQMPYSKVLTTTYEANPTQAFYDYFTETQTFATPFSGNIMVRLADGSMWSTMGTAANGVAVSGDWNENYVNENNTFNPTIRCHGSVVMEMKNTATNEIANMTFTYTMKFSNPS